MHGSLPSLSGQPGSRSLSSLSMPALGADPYPNLRGAAETGPVEVGGTRKLLTRSVSTVLGQTVSAVPVTKLIHVRNIGLDPSKQYLQEAALVELISQHAPCVSATVRERVENGVDTSWALVAMENEMGVEKVLASTVMAGGHALHITRYSQKQARESSGAMARVAKSVDQSYFVRQSRCAEARLVLAKAQQLLQEGQEQHMKEIVMKEAK
jgi:hypothetical protein